jgi:hypothetical protein
MGFLPFFLFLQDLYEFLLPFLGTLMDFAKFLLDLFLFFF